MDLVSAVFRQIWKVPLSGRCAEWRLRSKFSISDKEGYIIEIKREGIYVT